MNQLDKIFELCARIEAKINEILDELDKLGVPKVDRETGEDIEEDNDNNNSGNNNDDNDEDESYIYDINRSI